MMSQYYIILFIAQLLESFRISFTIICNPFNIRFMLILLLMFYSQHSLSQALYLFLLLPYCLALDIQFLLEMPHSDIKDFIVSLELDDFILESQFIHGGYFLTAVMNVFIMLGWDVVIFVGLVLYFELMDVVLDHLVQVFPLVYIFKLYTLLRSIS